MTRLEHRGAALLAVLFFWAGPAFSWGPEGHWAIGAHAFGLLNDQARVAVTDIVGSDPEQGLRKSCFWPDTIRDTAEWSWTSPMHYVNLPRHATAYDRQRDCPDGLCATEGILKYANELGQPALDSKRRWQAFAWLCHLVGDLHQPLHAAFRDDRGGNRVDIVFRGQPYNLHRFWDSVLIRDRLGPLNDRNEAFNMELNAIADSSWNPADVAAWTTESHLIARRHAYPPGHEINALFADQSWSLIQQQWKKAAERLAMILNSVLSEEG
jgi:hypothetical protein